jgi:hypothetical protein
MLNTISWNQTYISATLYKTEIRKIKFDIQVSNPTTSETHSNASNVLNITDIHQLPIPTIPLLKFLQHTQSLKLVIQQTECLHQAVIVPTKNNECGSFFHFIFS